MILSRALLTNEGPGARFDHSAIAIGDNQMIIFGGRSEPIRSLDAILTG